MTPELWGTFSVRDHKVDRAFIADVLLYDRLVIPTSPDGEPEAGWPADWDLKKQRTLIADLGDLAIPIPWTRDRQAAWQTRFYNESAEARRLAQAEAAKD